MISPRGVASLLGKIALVAAAYCALKGGEVLQRAELFQVPDVNLNEGPALGSTPANRPVEAYNVIMTRNLFGSTAPAPVATPVPENVPRPKLRLVGTNVGKGAGAFAIIEDQNKNEQDIFSMNEQVFAYGKLIEISRELVKLQYPDRVDTLSLDDGKTAAAAPVAPGETEAEPATDDSQTEFAVAESELNDALSNLPLLLSHARAVPYFRNGQSIGMRLFAIRSGSLYEKLGLKNGDIITSVNDNSLSDPTQALRLFEQLKSERSITVKMERNGSGRDSHYSIR